MNLKKFLPDVLAVLFFVAVSVVYFIVPIRDGLVLTGHDRLIMVSERVGPIRSSAECPLIR